MISVVDQPPMTSSGRRPRLSDEDLQDLATAIEAGNWASDQETVPTKTAAYQRAQAAAKILRKRFNLTRIKIATKPVGEEFQWAIGPLADGEQPRRRRQSGGEEDGAQ